MNYKNILITGGAGFVGGNLAFKFKQDFPKVNITIFDNLRRFGSFLNIERLIKQEIQYVHGDIRNKEDLKELSPFDLLIECSAEPSVHSGYNSAPDYLINTNLVGTINCLEEAKKNKADVVFLSTSRVYPINLINSLNYKISDTRYEVAEQQNIQGISEKGISEKFSVDGFRSLYGTSKLASELFLSEYIYSYSMRGIINRCSILTGPWQMGKVDQGVAALWIINHILKKPLQYIGYEGKGKQVRDMLHIDDLYDLIKIELKNFDKLNGQIFNAGGGINNSFSLCELTEMCQNLTGNKIQFEYIPKTNFFDIPYFVTDNSKITSFLDWQPAKNLEYILKDIKNWFEKNKNLLLTVFDGKNIS